PRVHIDGSWEQAAVVLYDPQSDLALLKVATQAVSPLTVLNRNLRQGESVWAFGWPSGRYQTVGEGIYLGDWRGSMRVTSLVQAGQSGGALIACHSGRALLAGLVTGFGAREVDGTWLREPNMSLAVPAGKLLEFFRQADAVSFARAS
ncbi:MAG: serine protease, partial [Pseudomonadota bacterium]